MRTTHELQQEIRQSSTPSVLSGPDYELPRLPDYLSALLSERGLTVREVVNACNLDRSYGYQLFNGTRRPTRNMLLRLCLVLKLSEEEAQRLLKLSGRPALYPRSRFDAAVLYGMNHRMSLEETDELLASLGEESLL